ncbi:MAG: hypothetical protein LBT53_08670 [Puniceicoccales bacterium]|jgi:hypothetical protein|nr:hypothetical protein [Puniceicoccales bacterium]
MKRTLITSCLVASLLVGAGCTPVAQDLQTGLHALRIPYKYGDFDKGSAIADGYAKKCDESGNRTKNSLVWHLENATFLRYTAKKEDFQKAQNEFEKATLLWHLTKADQDRTFAGVFSGFYRPKRFESAFMFTWHALNSQYVNDTDSALGYLVNYATFRDETLKTGKLRDEPLQVLVRKTSNKEIAHMRHVHQESRRNSKQPTPVVLPEDIEEAKIRIWERTRDTIARKFAPNYGAPIDSFPRREEVRIELPSYLYFLFLWSQANGNTDIAELENEVRELKKNSQHPVVLADIARFEQAQGTGGGRAKKTPRPAPTVYVFFETGNAPFISSTYEYFHVDRLARAHSPFEVGADKQMLNFPEVHYSHGHAPYLTVSADGASPTQTVKILDVREIVSQYYTFKLPGFLDAQVGKIVHSAASQITSRDKQQKDKKHQEWLANLRPEAREAMIRDYRNNEKNKAEWAKVQNGLAPDDRAPSFESGFFETQPDNVQVARVDRPQNGVINITVGATTKQVKLEGGNVTVVWVKSSHGKADPVITQFTLSK